LGYRRRRTGSRRIHGESSRTYSGAVACRKMVLAEVFGLDNLLVPNWPITEIRSGKPAIVAYKDLNAWLARGNNKDTLFKYLKKWKMMK